MSFRTEEVKLSITYNGHVSIKSSLIWFSCLNSFIFLSAVYNVHKQYVITFCLINFNDHPKLIYFIIVINIVVQCCDGIVVGANR